MMSFIEKHCILFVNQHGFRQKHSTILALIEIVDRIKTNIDNNLYTVGIFLDLEKAFDTVNHDILYGKLEHYGFRGHSLTFLKSYLSDRKQFTRINGCNSKTLPVEYGVPQGSVLGPLLFLLYINDIQYCIDTDDLRLFADDTSIFLQNANLRQLLHDAQSKIKNLYLWFTANKLSLSFHKSCFVIYHGKNKYVDPDIQEIKFGDKVVSRQYSARYIGLAMDETLSWDIHVSELLKSLYKFYSLFYNIREFIPKKMVHTIYNACVYSRIKYALELYGSCRQSLLNKLQTTQNKLLKVLSKRPPRYDTTLLHEENNLLRICDNRSQTILHFVFNCLHGNPINCFENYFTFQENRYNTRQSYILNKTRIFTEMGRSTIKFTGATLWNNLPLELRMLTNFNSFRRKLRLYYRNQV